LNLHASTPQAEELIDGRSLDNWRIEHGNARDLLRRLAPSSIQCVVTSSPYWGMRIYENTRPVKWADGDHCAYGFEQTPEGFIRHTVELLYLLKPALAASCKRIRLVEPDGHLQHAQADSRQRT
jgi:hypothetical protein